MVGGGAGRPMLDGGGGGSGMLGGGVGEVRLRGGVGSVGSGMVGGGAGGGRPMEARLRRGVMVFCCAKACCRSASTLGVGLWDLVSDDGASALDILRPGTKDGVDAMARIGRFDRKGAWSAERTCTEAGRRSCCDACAECRLCGLVVGVMFEAADGGLTGAVTDRFMTIPDGSGEGVGEGVREDCRLGRIVDESPCCA